MRSHSDETASNQNEAFWNELCGTGLAKVHGINDHSIDSIKRYDEAYFDFYPYLLGYIAPERMKGRKVLEIGLGYGTLGRKIVEEGADYLGTDIAPNPAKMLNHSFELLQMPGRAVQGDFLVNEFKPQTFDYVVSIGCFHHTGDIPRCLDETYRILKPDGTAIIMLYNQFSSRQWIRWPLATFKALFQDVTESNVAQRKAYDSRSDETAAPVTEFSSIKRVRKLFSQFSDLRIRKENCDDIRIPGHTLVPRKLVLPWLGPWMGLDLYIEARK